MSARRSIRTKAAVKYTSDSEGSEFGAPKARKATPKKSASTTPRKTPKRPVSQDISAATPTYKRAKKDPETIAAELREKAAEQDAKAMKQKSKANWEEWMMKNDVNGKMLHTEPDKDEAITQTDCLKKYGLKKEELGSLLHFEKKNPLYGGTMKLFIELHVQKLAFRRFGMLAGFTDDKDILAHGEKQWEEKQKNGMLSTPQKHTDAPKTKTPKQNWVAYLDAHALQNPASLADEPKLPINQTDSKTKYGLVPQDLAVLSYFPKPHQKYGNTTKLYKEKEVQALAKKKEDVLLGDEGGI